VSDGAVVLDDGERVAGKNLSDDVDVRKHRADRRGKDGNACRATREKTFANERAGNAVGYGVHSGVRRKKVYTIEEGSDDFQQRRVFGSDFADTARGDLMMSKSRQRSVREFRSD